MMHFEGERARDQAGWMHEAITKPFAFRLSPRSLLRLGNSQDGGIEVVGLSDFSISIFEYELLFCLAVLHFF